jgi:hypothetical protein
VKARSLTETLSKRAPTIVVWTLCASLAAAWFDAPVWLPTTLAIVVGALALLLLVSRGRRPPLGSREDVRVHENRNWLDWEIAGHGTPAGYYILAFFGFLTIMLIGFETPYARPAWAGLVLGIVWGIANRNYPADEEPGL